MEKFACRPELTRHGRKIGDMITQHKAHKIDAADFEALVIKSDVPVLVDWWAHWCGPCRMLATTMDQLATEYAGRARVVKLDCDSNVDFARKNSIQALPTVTLWYGGQERRRITGLSGVKEYRNIIEEIINKNEEKQS